MIVIGSVGNMLAFVVLGRRSVRRWSICVYLGMFALSNTLVLYVGCGLDWIANVTETPYVANLTDWSCRLWQFLFNVINYTTSWVVVAMVTDRFIALCLPSRARIFCTVFVAKVMCILILVFLMVISIHAMWTYELTPQGCYIDPTRSDFQSISWPYISATLYSYIPLITISLLSTIVSFVLLCGKTMPLRHQNDVNRHEVSLTHATLIASFCHVIMLLPTVVINLVEYSKPEWSVDHEKRSRLYLARTIGQTIACLSHSITYVIYFSAIPLCRTELSVLLRQMFTTSDKRHATVTLDSVRLTESSKPDCDESTLL